METYCDRGVQGILILIEATQLTYISVGNLDSSIFFLLGKEKESLTFLGV